MLADRRGVLLPLVMSALFCAAALAVVMISVRGERNQQTPIPVTAGELAQYPDRYFGKTVSVRAEVEDVLSRQVFLLDEDRLFAWPDVLVIAPSLRGPVPEDQIVTVTGTVRLFVDADLRRDYDWDWWEDLDPDVAMTFWNRPVIVAESVQTAGDTELVR